MAPPNAAPQTAPSDQDQGQDQGGGFLGGLMKMFTGGGGSSDGAGGGMGMWGILLLVLGLSMFGGEGGLLGGLFGGGLLGGGDGQSQGGLGGMLRNMLGGLFGGGDNSPAQSQGVPAGPTSDVSAAAPAGVPGVVPASLTTNGQRPAVAPVTDASDRGNKTLAAGLTMASLVNFDKPVPRSSVGANEQIKVADDLSQSGQFIKFYNDGTGQYEALGSNSTQALQTAIANDKSKRVSIVVGSETKYFQQIAQANREESATGFTAGAWRETDAAGKPVLKEGGKFDVWLGNPGYTADLKLDAGSVMSGRITDGTPQSVSMETISNPGNNLNPQAPEALAFANAVINQVGAENVRGFVTGSQSMGQSNMHAEYVMLKARNIAAQEITLDPIADTHQVAAMKTALANPNSALYQTLSSMGVAPDKIAELSREDFKGEDPVRVIFKGRDGQVHTTAEATLDIGKGLQQGIISYSQGTNRGEGNGMAGNRQEYLDLTGENLSKPEFDGHKLVNIFLGLEHGAAIYAAGQTMKGSNVTVADANGASTQPNLPGGQEQGGRTVTG